MGATDGHGHDGVHQRRPQHLVQSRHSQRHELPRLRRLLIRRRRPPPPPFPILLPQIKSAPSYQFLNCKQDLASWGYWCTSQIMGYTGINYSSPTLASAISNLVPAFTFILALIFRMEKLALRSSSSLAKIIGTIVSISGAFVVTLYKGLPIVLTPSPSISLQQQPPQSKSNWVLGGLFLTTEYILVPMWYIVQAKIMKEYPAELTVVFFYNLCVSVLAAIVGVIAEPNMSAWRIRFDISLASILCSGIFGSFLSNAVHTWVVRIRGPVYVAMFKPLSIVIAVAMGIILLGDALYLGSIVGATIISIGFYTVMWGKAKEEMGEGCEIGDLESSSDGKVPLLQSYRTQKMARKVEVNENRMPKLYPVTEISDEYSHG
ncbi:nodulin MtN21 /EamA-like transporter family protein [Actinidia rufa]|uniref:Nodulin MtN21 /EamA-like transporter family protein n=1 Tax=Actinidia rufa TaxID=165716 RepID=A0A7J0EL20_9ERIC|nr:nodulin MtN21 /EamA-like transporter family protein [Actinidia rufa]